MLLKGRCGPADAFRSRYGPPRAQQQNHRTRTKICLTPIAPDTGTCDEPRCRSGYGGVRKTEAGGAGHDGERRRSGYVRLWTCDGIIPRRRTYDARRTPTLKHGCDKHLADCGVNRHGRSQWTLDNGSRSKTAAEVGPKLAQYRLAWLLGIRSSAGLCHSCSSNFFVSTKYNVQYLQ